MAGPGPGDFGGLCSNGHDVPVGAYFCPNCGAPAVAPSGVPPTSWGPAQSLPPQPQFQPYPPSPNGPWPAVPGAERHGPPAWVPQNGPQGGPWNAPPPPPYWNPGYAPARATNGFAIASMVLGILWVYWVGSVLAVIFGHIALRQIRVNGDRGRGMAIAGLVLGYVGIATIAVIVIAVFVAGG